MKKNFKDTTYSKIIYSLSLLLLLTIFIQCNSGKKYEMSRYIESNIDYCMAPLIENGVDSLRARSICRCTLEEMFKIEPNLLKLNHRDWDSIFESNKDNIMDKCPELKKIYTKYL